MARAPRAIVVSGMVLDVPVAGSCSEPATTVRATGRVPRLAPQLTSRLTSPVAVDGTVAVKVKLPVASAVPVPTSVPSTDALTAPPSAAPDPVTVTDWPGSGVVSETVALQPP